VVVTGYFSRRLAEMLRRRGAQVVELEAPLGQVPDVEQLASTLERSPSTKVVCLTHVDTSTGILLDPAPYAALARAAGALVVLDGVCATGGERLQTSAWGIDVALTGSQKALGLPPGLALLVVSDRAIEARRALPLAPAMMLDWLEWLPVHRAYEERRPSYFATPATSLIAAAAAGLDELLAIGVDAVLQRHRRAAGAMRAVWANLGLREVPDGAGARAHTLSNLWLPEGIGDEVRARIAARGAVVAGGLLPELRGRSVRVGHMGWITGEPEVLRRVAAAVAAGLVEGGLAADAEAALAAFDERWHQG
jgi:alanine-glyoxylate transaminase/serine-glyoxylate transaminase/serine-pyruvate transaminase